MTEGMRGRFTSRTARTARTARTSLPLLALLLAPAAALAAPEPLGVEWSPVPLRAPVVLDEVSGLPPFVPARVPEVQGEVELSVNHSAALFLPALELVQLRAEPGTLRFHRITVGREPTDAWLRVEEPGIPVRAGVWYLSEPVGDGSLWVVTASRPTKLRVERPGLASRHEGDEELLRSEVLRFIDGRGLMPALPFHAELRHRLAAEAELGAALLRGVAPNDPLNDAVRAWRKASALRVLWTLQPLEGPTLRTKWVSPPGESVSFEGFLRSFTRTNAEGAHEWEVEGPGVFALDARAVLNEGTRTSPLISLTDAAGRTLAQTALSIRAARVGELPALPVERPSRELSPEAHVGAGEELRVPLGPGKQVVRLSWHGGQVLVRARVVTRRPQLAEQWRGVADWTGWADEALAALQHSDSPARHVLTKLVTQLHPEAGGPRAERVRSASMPEQTTALAPELALHLALLEAETLSAQLTAQPGDAAARLFRQRAAALPQLFGAPWLQSGSELAWSFRVRAARLMLDANLADEARALIRGPGTLPPSGHLTAELAEVLSRMGGSIAWRSRSLAALELAWRQDPLALDIRRQYRAAFAREGRWSALSPSAQDDRPRPLPVRWLDVERLESDEAPGAGAHFPLEPGEAVRVEGPAAADAARILRAFVLTTETTEKSEVPVVHVDSLRVPLMPLSAIEPMEVALPRGDHTLRLEAQPGTRAWLSIPPAHARASSVGEVAYLRTHYPARARGEAVTFSVPDAQVPGPVRLQLRGANGTSRPIGVWIHTDVGQPRRAVLFPGTPSLRNLSVDERPGPGSSAASLVLHLPAHSREVWIEPDDPETRLFASLAVRRAQRTTDETLNPREREADVRELADADVERLLELSRTLSAPTTPDSEPDVAALLDRAQLLLDVGEESYARDDLVRALMRQRQLTPENAERLAAILESLEAEPQDVGRFADLAAAGAPKGPLLLSPGSARLPGTDEARAALSKRLRGLAPGDALKALGDSAEPLDRWARARLLSAGGSPERAALELMRLYREQDDFALGMDAVSALERVQTLPSAWTDWGAPMGVALTTELSSVIDLPKVRRVGHDARRFARWLRLRDADAQVGTLDLLRAPEEEPRDRIQLALHAPPWPMAGTRVLPQGQAAVLQTTPRRTERVGAEAMCQSVRADVRPPGQPCRFALRLDGREVAEARAAVGEVVTLTTEVRAGGRHQLELVFETGANAPSASAAARFIALEGEDHTQARALEAEAPMPVLRARPGVPMELTALGPTALRIESRAFGGESRLTITDGEGRTPRTVSLSAEPDPAIHGAPFAVGHASETLLLLPDEGPHRLRFEAEGSEALVRVGLGGTRPPSSRRAEWWTRSPTALEPLPWPAQPETLALLPEGAPKAKDGTPGTLSVDLGLLGEYLDEGEVDRPLEGRLRGLVAYRQEVRPKRAWLLVAPEVRHPLERNPAFGGTAGLHLRRLPLELRATVMGRVFLQDVGGGLRYGARLRGSVDRWIGLTPDLGLIPGLGLTVEHFGGAPGDDALGFDRAVFWRYGEQHPVRPSPRLSLRWQPLQDHVGMLTATTLHNPELLTLDHVAGRVQWAALLPFYPNARASLGYEASYRMIDLHRSEPYLRHGLRARADVGFWQGQTGRLLFYAEDALYLGTPWGAQNTLTLGVRWDWTRGRGLRDFMPFEEEFEDLVGPAP